jgi:hypothetical protein
MMLQKAAPVCFPLIADLAMFLLDANIQAANCERLFKEFSRLHTKVRNRLDPMTTHKMAQVKYDVRRKYRNGDHFDTATKGSTNRFVSADEHPRKDTPVSPAAKKDAAAKSIRSIVKELEEESEAEDEDNAEQDDETDNELDIEEEGSGGALLGWMRALSAAVSEDLEEDDIFFETEEDGTRAGIGSDKSSADRSPSNGRVDCFEKRRVNLLALPEENDANWPQENQHYFTGKKPEGYVRTDKYALSRLHALCQKLPRESKLPSIMSVYSKQG